MEIGPKKVELLAECIKRDLKFVGFRGNPHAPIMFVGEAPGADEDQAGVPFVGQAGRQLDGEISEAGIDGSFCSYTNPYKTRPPDNEIDRLEELGIPKALHESVFFEELHQYRPSIIVPTGATSLELLAPQTTGRRGEASISKWRGSILTSPRLNWPHYIIPIYHPAFILREYSERSINVFILRRVLEEFSYFRKNGRFDPLPQRQLIANPSAAEAKEYLHECLAHNGWISTDIELVDRKVPITVSFSYDPKHAISIEFLGFDRRDAVAIWRLIDRILLRSKILGQNYTTFDANWLYAMGFNVSCDRVDDTLVRHHVLHPELSHKLDFQVMQYTREPYYKDEGRGWKTREGLTKLKLYNCKDSACTIEVALAQETEFDESPDLRRFYNYEMALARAFYNIDRRGILVDQVKLAALRAYVVKELDETCLKISKDLKNRPVVYNANQIPPLMKVLGLPSVDVFLNVSSPMQLRDLLTKELKIKLKIDRLTHKESTNEDSLQAAFADTGNPILKNILRTRELTKSKGTYIDARLSNGVLYGCASVTGTVTGRRASRSNFLGFGTNLQNQPKHSDLGAKLLDCHIARPGKIFVSCDQASAEEWIVQGIIADVSGDDSGIRALRESISSGISRHAVLASQIFGLPIDKTNDKNCLEYYLGKKVRHAGNYDMQDEKMQIVLASEGFNFERKFCAFVLQRFHEVEPAIRGVFHEYIKRTLVRDRRLITPLGRERVFHGLHPTRDNGKIFREGYAYIPQSSVGDNTGMAMLACEQQKPGWVIQDKHDAILLEVADIFETALEARTLLLEAFDRVFRFPNGFELRIPIDFEIGYSVRGLRKCPDLVEGWRRVYEGLERKAVLAECTQD